MTPNESLASPMEKGPAITLGSYYGAAIPRAFWAGWNWAFGQGLALTILLGCAAVAWAALYAVIRAWRRSHSWADAVKSVRHIIADFLISGVGAIVIALIGLFVWFFVNDAPNQLNAAHMKIEELQKNVVSLSPPSPPPKPFYSQNDKNKLADMLTDLSDILNNEALVVETATNELLRQMRNEMMGRPEDTRQTAVYYAVDSTLSIRRKLIWRKH